MLNKTTILAIIISGILTNVTFAGEVNWVNSLSKGLKLAKDSDKDRADTSKYKVNGWPTIVFLDSAGREIDRNAGYAGPDELAKIMEKLLKK